MSRLPRLRSSSPERSLENVPALTTTYVNTRKRKSTIDEEDEPQDLAGSQPRKVAALGTSRPTRSRTAAAAAAALAPSKTAPNVTGSNSNSTSSASSSKNGGVKVPTLSSSNFGKGLPKGMARPRSGAATTTTAKATATTRPTRGTSAPPVSSNASTRPVRAAAARPTTGPAATARGGRTVSGPTRAGAAATTRRTAGLSNSQVQLARQADLDRLAQDMAAERSKVSELQANHLALSRELSEAKAQELSHRRELVNFTDELEDMRKKHRKEVAELEAELRKKDREARDATEDLRLTRADLERERITTETLRTTVATQTQTQIALSTENEALKAQLSALRRTLEEKNTEVEDMKQTVEEKERMVVEMKKEVFESETIRRKLHNTILELKGNIRVFCRVRPVLPSDLPPQASPEEVKANMAFPDKRDHKEIVLYSTSESAMGVERKEVYNFGFDRVFEPESTQREVFEEISQLAQSCIDGYNVCIFAYGQTGSGKSFTMEGGSTEATAGMIPRAVEQVFRVAEEMKSKGWEYKIEGQFLEIYNETIHDLLSTSTDADTKKKHEIKHDLKTGRTTVTDATVVPLHSPSQVKILLARAQSRRSVAATLMNERSSRSHSVFTLRISGVNVGVRASSSSTTPENTLTTTSSSSITSADELVGTGERCEGCLNLVDLAGSERLNVSFGPGVTEKERVKETQSINKSLSALGDVIAALGERGGGREQGHIPYRNSKLTYLLQNSLSGNSKTLMVLNLSPLAAHLQESLTSLRFATKVNNTHVGTAKKVAKATA
ncbi:kinesin [Coprinopsis cinerea AmutBmut pab1-1]|nr:kinesin [Coprinopsis cinerea AmutBmut pab1-1]